MRPILRALEWMSIDQLRKPSGRECFCQATGSLPGGRQPWKEQFEVVILQLNALPAPLDRRPRRFWCPIFRLPDLCVCSDKSGREQRDPCSYKQGRGPTTMINPLVKKELGCCSVSYES